MNGAGDKFRYEKEDFFLKSCFWEFPQKCLGDVVENLHFT